MMIKGGVVYRGSLAKIVCFAGRHHANIKQLHKASAYCIAEELRHAHNFKPKFRVHNIMLSIYYTLNNVKCIYSVSMSLVTVTYGFI